MIARRDFVLAARTRDTWIHAGGAWRLKLSEVSEIHVTVDGKPTGRPGGAG